MVARARRQALSDAVLLFPDTEPPAEPRIPAGSGANAAPHLPRLVHTLGSLLTAAPLPRQAAASAVLVPMPGLLSATLGDR